MKTEIYKTIIFLLFSLNVAGQEYFIFVNHNTILEQYNFEIREDQTSQGLEGNTIKSYMFQKGIFSINYSRINNKILTEYTLMPFHIKYDEYLIENKENNIYYGYTTSYIRSNFTYKISYTFRDLTRKFRPYLGVGVGLFYENQRYYPKRMSHFPRKINKFSFSGIFNVGFNYQITERLFFNLQIPINLIEYYFIFDEIENPIIPQNERTKKDEGFIFMPEKYLFKLGIGFRLTKKE